MRYASKNRAAVRNVLIVSAAVAFLALSAGFSCAETSALDRYISRGLESNLALQQKEFSLRKSLEALREARGMFLPSLSIDARYSRAGGGRMIVFPLGDLINPIHLTLNQFLASTGQSPLFPGNLSNINIPFLREKEYQTTLRLVQPIFQPALIYNEKIRSGLTRMERAGVKAYARELVAEIKTAYFNHVKALQVCELLRSTRELLDENLRVSESLVRNGLATEEVILRAKAELSRHDQQEAEADKNVSLSRAYFNFLLNQPLDAGIDTTAEPPRLYDGTPDAAVLAQEAIVRRPEFAQIREAAAAAGNQAKIHASSALPGLAAVVDYGFQGEQYRFGKDDDYWMASLVLSWNLFNGGRDKALRNQALLEQRGMESRIRELENSVRLQVEEAVREIEVAVKSEAAAEQTLRSAKESFAIIARKFEQGLAPQIEYIQARNEMTAAEINRIICGKDIRIKEARLEFAVASYSIPSKED